MVSDTVIFGLSTAGIAIGLVVMLYGVSLNSGQSLNTLITVGGLVILLSMGGILAGGWGHDEAEHA